MKKNAELRTALLISLAVILVSALAIILVVFTLTRKLQLWPAPFPNAQKVVSVNISNGVTGETLVVENSKEIEEIVKLAKEPVYLLGTDGGGAGFRYKLSFYDASGKRLLFLAVDTIEETDKWYALVGDFFYCTDVAELYQYVSELDWSQAEKP